MYDDLIKSSALGERSLKLHLNGSGLLCNVLELSDLDRAGKAYLITPGVKLVGGSTTLPVLGSIGGVISNTIRIFVIASQSELSARCMPAQALRTQLVMVSLRKIEDLPSAETEHDLSWVHVDGIINIEGVVEAVWVEYPRVRVHIFVMKDVPAEQAT